MLPAAYARQVCCGRGIAAATAPSHRATVQLAPVGLNVAPQVPTHPHASDLDDIHKRESPGHNTTLGQQQKEAQVLQPAAAPHQHQHQAAICQVRGGCGPTHRPAAAS
jgi:hypothetical protein